MIPLPLRRQTMDKRVIATPAFRMLGWIEGNLSDPASHAAVMAVFEAFVARWGDRLDRVRLADSTTNHEPVAWNAADMRTWLESVSDGAMTARGLGPVDAGMDLEVPPQIRLEQANGFVLVEASVPPDSFDATLAAEIAGALRTPRLFCAVQGYGFYLPDTLDSFRSSLPQSYPRYRTAIEVPVGAKDGLRRLMSGKWPVGAYAKIPDAKGGITDIGWRTIIGEQYRDRLAPVKAADLHPDVTVEDADGILTLTAGPAPIWGDVNAGEDIAAYRSVARYLRPAMIDPRIAYRSLFGSKDHTAEDRESVEGYLRRLLPAGGSRANAGNGR